MSPLLRRTRFVCVSDTHNASPATGSFLLPKGDVLVHAGDLTNQGTFSELQRTVDWIEKADFEAKIVVAGNHDITLDTKFYSQHGQAFHNQNPQVPAECLWLLQNSPSITYLNHETKKINLLREDGPRTYFKVFGSPYSPARDLWAFSYTAHEALTRWEDIPLDTDLVVTHTPPMHYCDESKDRGAAGCANLRQTLWRIRPQLAICGHVHEGRGIRRIQWNQTLSDIEYVEQRVGYWMDPAVGNKKQSYLDLSARGGEPLNHQLPKITAALDPQIRDQMGKGKEKSSFGSSLQPNDNKNEPDTKDNRSTTRNTSRTSAFAWTAYPSPDNAMIMQHDVACPESAEQPVPFTRASATGGHGVTPPSGQCELETLAKRIERRETCVINASIMASSWPHKGGSGKRCNKAIVVDIDLPVWHTGVDAIER